MGFNEERGPSLVDIAAHKATVQPEFNENASYSRPHLNSTDAASRMPFAPGQHRFWRLGMDRRYWRQELKNIDWLCQRSSHDLRLGLAQAVYLMRPIRRQ